MSKRGHAPILISVLIIWVVAMSGSMVSQVSPLGEERGSKKEQEVGQLKEPSQEEVGGDFD